MKKNEMRLHFCKGDMAVIVFVILLAIFIGVLFYHNTGTKDGNIAVVYQNGEKIKEISLNQEAEYIVEHHYTNKIVVKDKKVAIMESDCPGADCVHSGWIKESGRSIICLPNRVEIRIEGAAEVDFIIR